jgi:phospholipase D-like protein
MVAKRKKKSTVKAKAKKKAPAKKKATAKKTKAAAKPKAKTKKTKAPARPKKPIKPKKPAKPKAPVKPKAPPATPSKPAQPAKPTTPPAPIKPAQPTTPQAASGFEVVGTNAAALFTLKAHRGEGMTLLAMNWKTGQPPNDFVGFAIEYQEPGATQYFPLKNRLGFPDASGKVDPASLSTLQSPIQKFRWVHFPQNADLAGNYNYRVTPMFMDASGKLTAGAQQQVAIALARETYPGVADVTFTRGFVSSQAFIDYYEKDGPINTLVAPLAAKGLDFKPTHPDADAAYAWMGFGARTAILDLLDAAVADTTAQVRVVAYDFNLPEVVDRLEKLGPRLKIIIDNSGSHGKPGAAENEAETRLVASAGRGNVLRQHMGSLQHNKTVAVSGNVQRAVCGSTNLSWRGFFVQSNNALVVYGKTAVGLFFTAFDAYFTGKPNDVAGFAANGPTGWSDLGLPGIDAKISFSPHNAANAKLQGVADDVKTGTTSSLLYSLAFLYETPGVILDAIKAVTANASLFVYGLSDKKVGGIDVQDPGGNVTPVYASQLTSADAPPPFKPEDSGGMGVRLHHKFLVIDFDKPTARVYLGSYNFSKPADLENGENVLIVKDRRIAVSYMIEALTMFDHYSFRVAEAAAANKGQPLQLQKPPSAPGDKPWWSDDWTVGHKIKDRELFA